MQEIKYFRFYILDIIYLENHDGGSKEN